MGEQCDMFRVQFALRAFTRTLSSHFEPYPICLHGNNYPHLSNCRSFSSNAVPNKTSPTKAEFWRQHEAERLKKAVRARNEFIEEKHGLMLVYSIIGFTGLFGCYYFFTDFSFQDRSAIH